MTAPQDDVRRTAGPQTADADTGRSPGAAGADPRRPVVGPAGDPTGDPAGRVPSPVASGTAAFWLAWYSFRELSRRRRLISLAFIASLPVLLVVALRIWYEGELLTPRLILTSLSYHTFLPFLVPVFALAVGVSAIGEQVSEGTLIYPWSRPVRRGAIYVGRVLAAQLVGSSLLVASLVACFLAMVIGRWSVLSVDLVRLYVTTCVVLVLGSFAYTALFAWVGTVLRRPLLVCILFAFGWEPLVGGIPQRIQEYTLRFHLRNLIERPEPPSVESMAGLFERLITTALVKAPVPEWRSLLILVLAVVLATALGIQALGRKEMET
ncbi:MAG: ABC transporter permease subunit [Candidatus Krumholzibacteriia bacterium]